MNGPRKTDVLRDLPGVAALLRQVFGAELQMHGLSLADGLCLLGWATPLIWGLGKVSSRFRDRFQGYVWEEDGRLVGNASVARLDRLGRSWMIGNVAVHPGFRRRGIGRRLTQLAIHHCLEQGAEVIMLEVRRDNTAAYDLYLNLGFCQVHSLTRLRRHGVARIDPPSSAGYAVSSLPPREWDRARRLRRLAAPGAVAGVRVSLPWDSEPGFGDWFLDSLVDRLTGGRGGRWGLEKEGTLVAYLELLPLPGRGSYRMHCHVHPGFRGVVEETLVALALSRLSSVPFLTVHIEVPEAEVAQLPVLYRYGFHRVEVLDTLALAGARPGVSMHNCLPHAISPES